MIFNKLQMLTKGKIFKTNPDDRGVRGLLCNYTIPSKVRRVGELCRVTNNIMLKVFSQVILV